MNYLNQSDQKLDEMSALVQLWANINSHSHNLAGILRLLEKVQMEFRALQPDVMRVVEFKKSAGLFLKKRGKANIQIFMGGHLDTVFPANHPFQQTTLLDAHTLRGPGVTDMKGGLVVLLKAVEQFEKMDHASSLGWEIFLNADEEIGSPESTPFIEECASRCQMALLFEPCFPDGALVSSRKGSANYKLISRGKKAHAGRTPESGKHAIYPLARFITEVESLHDPEHGTIVNVGLIKGGEALNIIPDYAECGINIRCNELASMQAAKQTVEQCALKYGLELIQETWRAPKPFTQQTETLFQALQKCGTQLGLVLTWKPTGGVCDGNTFAAQGVPTVDTLGVRGGEIHTENEYLDLRSLPEKRDLTALFLSEIAMGNICRN